MNQSEFALTLILLLGVLGIVGTLAWSSMRARRRAACFREPFPAEWRAMLERTVPLYRRMPQELRLRLEPIVRAFLADVQFIGRNGLAVTEEMRLAIAAQACVLVVARDPGPYASLRTVLLYPEDFIVKQTEEDEAGVVHEGEDVLAGQSVEDSQIVLSWRDVRESGTEGEIFNVVLHEFAHFLDNSVEGTLTDTGSRRAAFEAWHDLLDREYRDLCEAVDRDEETLIDPYGSESTAEFFAVATETFFEAPRELKHLHPALHAGLAEFYGLDPAAWP